MQKTLLSNQKAILLTLLVFISVGAALFLFLGKTEQPSPKPEENQPQVKSATSTKYDDIRKIDFEKVINGYNKKKGHVYVPPTYTDLTGDGKEEAMVGFKEAVDDPEPNYLMLYVYTLSNGEPSPITSLKRLYKGEYIVTKDKLLTVTEYTRTPEGGLKAHKQIFNFVTGEYKQE